MLIAHATPPLPTLKIEPRESHSISTGMIIDWTWDRNERTIYRLDSGVCLHEVVLGQTTRYGARGEMGRQVAVVLYVVAMAVVMVGVDFVFFRNRFWERLAANIGIAVVFAAFYWRFFRHP